MTEVKNLADSLEAATELWLDFLQSEYDNKYWNATKILLKSSNQPDMDQKDAYKAGLGWLAVYDLASAMGSGHLKNPDLLTLFVGLISGRISAKENKIWDVVSAIPNGALPHEIFLEIYISIDPTYKYNNNETQDTVEGFIFYSKKVMNLNYLGKILTGKLN